MISGKQELIKAVERPSSPGEDLTFIDATAEASSSDVIGGKMNEGE